MSELETAAVPKPRKTKVHSPAQLQAALRLNASAWARARYAELVPGPDRAAGTYSGELVDELVARAEQIRADVPADLLTEGDLRAAVAPGYEHNAEWRRAEEAGLIPAPDHGAFYSRQSVAEMLADPEAWRASIPAQPLGTSRCARLLAELTGLAVCAEDIEALAEAGYTAVVKEFEGFDLYDVDRLRALPENAEGLALLRGWVEVRAAERAVWIEASISPEDAAAFLRWPVRDLARVAKERNVLTGREGRYARTDIGALADDEELCEQVRRSQLVGPDQAAEHMEIRRTDFEYVLAAGWVQQDPDNHVERQVGRYKYVDVQLYRVGDLEDALTIPGVDWEAVRSVRPGEVSPLREYAQLSASRAEVIHAFGRELREEFGIEVWPHWVNPTDTWEIDWEQDDAGRPTTQEIRARLVEHPGASKYRRQIRLSTEVGEIIRWGRRMLQPGAAVVLDFETTGLFGSVGIEVAVIDAATGRKLLDTLVSPAGVEVEAGARAVHGITDDELAGAPSWAEVWPKVRRAAKGRTILTYNANFDRGVMERTHERAGLDLAELPQEWGCLMQARSIRARVGYRIALGGSHRALGDARDARTVLQAIATARNPDQRR